MSEWDHIEFVTKVYNWKGVVNAFAVDDPNSGQRTWVPLAAGNRHYHQLTERIAEGKCEVREPQFTFYTSVHGKSHRIVGYDTNLGFVPNDSNNALYQLLSAAMSTGTVEDRGETPTRALPYCTHLKFCLFFPRPWPHLSGPFSSEWEYRASQGASAIKCGIRLSNHPEHTSNPVRSGISFLGVDVPHVPEPVAPLRHAMLEIEFAINDLWKLYQGESAAGFGWLDESIADQLEQGRVRYDRQVGSPDTRTLLQLAPQFLRRAVVDIANDVAGSFNREFGGYQVGFAREVDLQQQFLCFLRGGENHHLWQLGQQPPPSFNLSGEWRVRKQTIAPKTLPLRDVAQRLKALIEAGFAFEAMAVANAFYEVVCRHMIAGVVAADSQAVEWVMSPRFGYDRCRRILSDAIEDMADTYGRDEVKPWLAGLDEVYHHRNLYMHALQVCHELDRTVDTARETASLLRPLLDVFDHSRLMFKVNSFVDDGGALVGPEAAARAISAVLDHRRSLETISPS